MIDFLIFYEVGVREFESIALLGHELKKRGYTVDYIGFEDVDHNRYIKKRKEIKKYFNNVNTALMPSLYHDKEIYNTVYYVCGECVHIVNLRWEQYFGNGPMNDFDSALFPHEDAKRAYHFCWGEVSRQSLIVRGNDEGLLPITGAIQLDFLRPEFSGFYKSKDELFPEYGINLKKKTVLYISSFATATRTERLKEAVKKDFSGKYDFKDNTLIFHRESYEVMIDWIEEFLKRYPDVQFIYRPHPAENITDYISKLKKYINFFIISEHSVKQWIICCNIITTWVSTSITEAFFADKFCYVIRPLPYPHDIDICVYNGVKYIDKFEDFLGITEENKNSSINEEQIKSYYSFTEIPAYIRTADELEKIHSKGRVFEWKQNKEQAFDRRRRLLFCRNILFDVYLTAVKCLAVINQKTGIKFHNRIQTRIDNFKAVKGKNRNQSISLREELDRTIEKVNRYMKNRMLEVK